MDHERVGANFRDLKVTSTKSNGNPESAAVSSTSVLNQPLGGGTKPNTNNEDAILKPSAIQKSKTASEDNMLPTNPSDAHPTKAKRMSIHLNRCPLTQDEFLSSYDYHGRESATVMDLTRSVVKSGFSCPDFGWKNAILNFVPLIRWLPRYSVKKDLLGDLIAGFTVAVLQIPQGMAYALLAGLPAVNGLYMAFFPVLVYMIFGTSKQSSVGTFAVVLLMTGSLSQQILEKHGSPSMPGAVLNGTHIESSGIRYHPTQTVALVAFCVGTWQATMGVMRIGALSVVLSDVLSSGFTTGASMHILTSQIKGIFGIEMPRPTKFPKLIRTYVYLLDHLYESNAVALIVSSATMVALAVNNDFIKPRLATRCRFPVPIELMVVVGGTLYSHFMQLHDRYNLTTLGEIPTGIPSPELPPLEILKDALTGSFVIAIVAFTTSYSMAMIFAKKLNYEVDPNQELIAHGLSNIAGSFFRCGPSAASLSRSLIQHSVGGKSQISGGISACIILVILLYLGPFFESLPRCILSAIIIVSLKGLFVQFADFGRAWRSSKLDALIWMSTFASVVIVDIDYGLLIGVSVSLVTLLWRNQRAYACVLGEIPKTGIYVDSRRFDAAKGIHNVKIFHFGSGLHFANRVYFRDVLFSLTGLDPVKWHKQAMKRVKKENQLMLRDTASQASIVASRKAVKTNSSHILCCVTKRHGREEARQPQNHEESIRHDGSNNSTEIREITLDVKSLSGGVTVGDSFALPSSTGLRLRRSSIHIDTTGNPLPFRYLLIDLSGICFIDMAGVKLLKSLVQDYDRINIQVLFAGTTEPVLHMFRKMSFYKDVPKQCFFPTVNDAVVCIQWRVIGFRKERLTSVNEQDEE